MRQKCAARPALSWLASGSWRVSEASNVAYHQATNGSILSARASFNEMLLFLRSARGVSVDDDYASAAANIGRSLLSMANNVGARMPHSRLVASHQFEKPALSCRLPGAPRLLSGMLMRVSLRKKASALRCPSRNLKRGKRLENALSYYNGCSRIRAVRRESEIGAIQRASGKMR